MALTHYFKPAIPIPVTSFHQSSSSSSPLFTRKPQSTPLFLGSTISRFQNQISPPALCRRLFLPSVSGTWNAVTGGNSAREAVASVRRGMMLFRRGDVSGSLEEFDKAIELDPHQKAYLWQRGLSLYYLDRFEEGAEQFRLDVAQNPNDTEESIWSFLCETRLYGFDEARRRFLELVSAFSSWLGSEYFYACLYAGLYYESQSKVDAAKVHILAASQSPYGLRSGDYMASLAEVHSLCRNWSST